jgi:hypothetical protein
MRTGGDGEGKGIKLHSRFYFPSRPSATAAGGSQEDVVKESGVYRQKLVFVAT